MNKCKYLKQKLNGTFECKKTGKIININDCKNCKYKEYKCTKIKDNCAKASKNRQQMHNNCAIKKKTNKLSKLERNRYSVFTDDLEHCIICGNKKDNLHEVFPGAYRLRSMKYHMVLPLCAHHHTQMHEDIELSLYWKRSCQKEFEMSHTREEFIKIFGKNYL